MRIFIAIDIPEDIKENIFRFIEENRRQFPEFKWIKKGALHLTLKFIGDASESDIEKIKKCLEQLAGKSEAGAARIIGVGVFPEKKSPRVLWSGVFSENKLIETIAARLDDSLPGNIPRENREFKAHITLARIKEFRKNDSDNLSAFCRKNSEYEFGSFIAEKLSIIESRLRPSGAQYSELYSVRLQKF